jgi:hypothetical protein
MPKKALHPLDVMAIQWKKEEELFFLDVPYSTEYFLLKNPIGTRNAWAIKEHNILESKNLKSIFDKQCRDSSTPDKVPWMDMLCDVFRFSFAPQELDLGSVLINTDYKLNDCFGEIGNIQNSGWVINQRLLEILKQFNIGEYRTYKIRVFHKGQAYDNYVYFHFFNYADKYVDYSKSKFYAMEEFDDATRKLIDFSSEAEFISNRKEAGGREVDIYPKELFLRENDLDLFKFDHLGFLDYSISKRLAEKLTAEKVTGFEIFQTTKVKKISET